MRPPSGSMHLLAYLPSADAEPLATRIREIGEYRASRNQRIVARLNELGYAVEWDDVAQPRPGPGRPAAHRRRARRCGVRRERAGRVRPPARRRPAGVRRCRLARPRGGRRARRRERRRARARPPVHAAPGRFRARALRSAPRRLRLARRRMLPARPRRRPARIHRTAVRAARASCRPEAPTGTAIRKARIWAIPGRSRFPRTRSQRLGLA